MEGENHNLPRQKLFFENQLWSIKTLSKYLDVPVATIRDWVFKHQISFVKVGRHVRFSPSDIQEWLLQNRSVTYDRNS